MIIIIIMGADISGMSALFFILSYDTVYNFSKHIFIVRRSVKMKRNIIIFISIIFVMSFLCRSYFTADADETDTTAAAYVLMEAETKRVLSENEAHKQLPAGAANKLMTTLLALEAMENGRFSPETELTASNAAHSASGAVIWLDAGEKITVNELLKGLIIGNAGDAATVFAEEISGDSETFTALMNERAAELGMKNTFFTSPYIIDDEAQYTTAYDIALLTGEISSHDEVREIMTTWLDRIRDGKTEVVNENSLVRSYDGITGAKAWHTEKSGYSLAASAERDGNRYVSVVLGCTDKDDRFKTGKQLLNTGFINYRIVVPGFSDEFMKPLRVKGGVDLAVLTKAEKISALVIPKGEEENLTSVLFLPDYIKAPVKKGQNVGVAAFYLDKTLLYETPLQTADNVEKNTFKKSLMKIIAKMFK